MGKENSFIQKHAELWKFIKFSFAGVFSYIIQYIVTLIFLHLVFKGLHNQTVNSEFFKFLGIDGQMDYAYSYLVGATVGYIVAFIMNRKVTFGANNGVTSSVIMYIIMVVFTVFVSSWMNAAFTRFAESKGYDVENGIVYFVIFALVTLIPFLWTYPLQRFVILRKKD